MSPNRVLGRRAGRYAVTATAALALAAGAATGLPAARAATPTPTATAAATAAAQPVSTSRVVLPTGDTVVVRTAGGRTAYSTLAADRSGITGSFAGVTVAGDRYVLPGEVQPLLGSLVDPSLFDVTALARSGGPATVTATVTSLDATVPGLTVTGRTATTVTGHVDASGAGAFRSALVEAAADVSAGRAPSSFPGVTRLSGATATPAGVDPAYPQVTLKIQVTAGAGQPAPSGFLVLLNTVDARRYNSFVFFRRGQARVSVPLGHYSGLANAFQVAPDGNSAVSLDVPISDYTVSDNLQTLTFDLSTATVSPSVTLPRPATIDDAGITWIRTDERGTGSTSFGDTAGGGVDLRWAPAPPAQYGEEDWRTTFHATGDTTAAPYTYDLSYATDGYVPSDGSHTVTAADVATIDASYYMDRRTDSAFGMSAVYPEDQFIFTLLDDLRTPTEVTEYVNDDPGATWSGTFFGRLSRFLGDIVDEFGGRSYPAGSVTPVDWLRGPLAPAAGQESPGGLDFLGCTACRTATRLSVLLSGYSDTEVDHFGEPNATADGSPAVKTALYADGRKIAGDTDTTFLQARVSPDPHAYRLHVVTDRSGDGDATSTGSVTDYGFTSSATTGDPLASDSYCVVSRDPSTCRTIGLLRVTAPLPTDLFRQVPVGSSSFTMTVAPYAGPGRYDPTRITSAEVGVSVDGRHFTPATVTRVGDQQFQVTLPTPAAWAGRTVTLRVSAADADGDTITQTTTAAYAVAAN